jgi:choice-of-anchor B domain-containing protein
MVRRVGLEFTTSGLKQKLSQQITYANDDFGHQLALSQDQRYVFFNDEAQTVPGNPARQIVFDFKSLSKPVALYQCLYPVDSITHDAYVVGKCLISGNYASGLRVVDISAVETTTCVGGEVNEVAWIDTEPRLNAISDQLVFGIAPDVTLNSTAPFAGIWGNYPYFKSGFIVVSDFYNGIFSVKIAIP